MQWFNLMKKEYLWREKVDRKERWLGFIYMRVVEIPLELFDFVLKEWNVQPQPCAEDA
jgi:hypothetical protein